VSGLLDGGLKGRLQARLPATQGGRLHASNGQSREPAESRLQPGLAAPQRAKAGENSLFRRSTGARQRRRRHECRLCRHECPRHVRSSGRLHSTTGEARAFPSSPFDRQSDQISAPIVPVGDDLAHLIDGDGLHQHRAPARSGNTIQVHHPPFAIYESVA